jgi:peroxiredoxin
LEQDLPRFEQANARVVAVAVQDQAGANATVQASNLSYPVLADASHRMAEDYGVYNLLNDGVAAPAVFVIDTTGRVVWSYIAGDINDRPDNQTILNNLPG